MTYFFLVETFRVFFFIPVILKRYKDILWYLPFPIHCTVPSTGNFCSENSYLSVWRDILTLCLWYFSLFSLFLVSGTPTRKFLSLFWLYFCILFFLFCISLLFNLILWEMSPTLSSNPSIACFIFAIITLISQSSFSYLNAPIFFKISCFTEEIFLITLRISIYICIFPSASWAFSVPVSFFVLFFHVWVSSNVQWSRVVCSYFKMRLWKTNLEALCVQAALGVLWVSCGDIVTRSIFTFAFSFLGGQFPLKGVNTWLSVYSGVKLGHICHDEDFQFSPSLQFEESVPSVSCQEPAW